ncbi:hypothetical protein DFR29_10947 [Tahibacter aquaticus]|uniref:Uncharacterized protein n=1 Tax=Tahibacter aquaticus TaxID=520092 RepID=A0A4R6YU90_9GAMM|nr:hypothetical protein DFR29_10947 [Tahibacter aquaticus]
MGLPAAGEAGSRAATGPGAGPRRCRADDCAYTLSSDLILTKSKNCMMVSQPYGGILAVRCLASASTSVSDSE